MERGLIEVVRIEIPPFRHFNRSIEVMGVVFVIEIGAGFEDKGDVEALTLLPLRSREVGLALALTSPCQSLES